MWPRRPNSWRIGRGSTPGSSGRFTSCWATTTFIAGASPRSGPRWPTSGTRSPSLCWLPRAGVVELTPETGLVGHDGWADGRLGDYAGPDVFLNDSLLIEDLAGLDREARLGRLHALGDEAAAYFRAVLPEALARF